MDKHAHAFFTHGIELNHFNNVNIYDFKGTASPFNPKAYRVYAEDGKSFSIDDKKNVVTKNVD
jgi:hypothetical protein